jgi:hypothetical protein
VTRLLARRLIEWLRPNDVTVQIPPSAYFYPNPELEHRRRLARETLVHERKNVDREKRLKALWLVK